MEWWLKAFNKYVVFSGRACRTEYNSFVIFNILIYVFLALFAPKLGFPEKEYAVSLVFWLIMLPPMISVMVRRLHDLEWSAWLIILNFVPVVNLILNLFLIFKKGSGGENKYGKPEMNVSGARADEIAEQ